jgi:hypothetical protein
MRRRGRPRKTQQIKERKAKKTSKRRRGRGRPRKPSREGEEG